MRRGNESPPTRPHIKMRASRGILLKKRLKKTGQKDTVQRDLPHTSKRCKRPGARFAIPEKKSVHTHCAPVPAVAPTNFLLFFVFAARFPVDPGATAAPYWLSMIETIWAHLSGKTQWPSATATVTSTELYEEPVYGRGGLVIGTDPRIRAFFTFLDAQGKPQTNSFDVGEDDALFQLTEGETFPVQYAPFDPEKLYFQQQNRAGHVFRYGLLILIAVSVLVAFLVF